MTTVPTNDEQLREAVRERYGRRALAVTSDEYDECLWRLL